MDTVHAVDEYTTDGALVGNAMAYTQLPFRWHENTVDTEYPSQ